jgi:hypothetical protein
VRGTTLTRRGATRLGDLPRLALPAERTTLLRVGLAVALAATLTAAILLARTAGSGRAAVLPAGTNTGVVVLDMSASVAGPAFVRIGNVVRGLVTTNQTIGLVMFSDVAYELLPPNSPPSSLQQFLRFFAPRRVNGGSPVFGQSPWDQFTGGTRIAKGLIEGVDALRRGGVTNGSLLLVSDLNDSNADREPLIAEALALRRAHIPVRIVPLLATAGNVQLFSRLFGASSIVNPKVFKSTAKEHVQPVAASAPWALLGVGVVLILLLAANERFNTRLVPESVT